MSTEAGPQPWSSTEPAPRQPWSPRWVRWTGTALEASFLVALVAMGAGGLFARPDAELPDLPIRLGLRDAPAIALIVAYAALRSNLRARYRSRRKLPLFVPICALVTAFAAGAHPDPARGTITSAVAGLVVGTLVAILGIPMNAFAESLEGDQPRPWHELHAAIALVTLGSLGSAARGGALVSAPTIALGVGLLARGLWEDARDLRRPRAKRAAPLVRLALSLTFLLLGVALGVVTTATSLGLMRAPH